MTTRDAHRKAAAEFSRYIRLRAADRNGLVYCVTCGRTMHWKSAQAGHFVRRGRVSVAYDPRNAHVQCHDCNCVRDGMEVRHAQYISRLYGPEVVEELRVLGKRVRRYTCAELEALAADYKSRADELERERR